MLRQSLQVIKIKDQKIRDLGFGIWNTTADQTILGTAGDFGVLNTTFQVGYSDTDLGLNSTIQDRDLTLLV
jgi:hypothetical protein